MATAYCLLYTAYCPLPTANCLPPTAHSALSTQRRSAEQPLDPTPATAPAHSHSDESNPNSDPNRYFGRVLYLAAMPAGQVYFFGRNAAMMALVDQQLKATGIQAVGYMDERNLLKDLATGACRLLVIGGGVEEEARVRLRAACRDRNVLVLEHHGGPGQLADNIGQALG